MSDPIQRFEVPEATGPCSEAWRADGLLAVAVERAIADDSDEALRRALAGARESADNDGDIARGSFNSWARSLAGALERDGREGFYNLAWVIRHAARFEDEPFDLPPSLGMIASLALREPNPVRYWIAREGEVWRVVECVGVSAGTPLTMTHANAHASRASAVVSCSDWREGRRVGR